MLPQNLVFLDLETTGANPLHDRIIEVGTFRGKNGSLEATDKTRKGALADAFFR